MRAGSLIRAIVIYAISVSARRLLSRNTLSADDAGDLIPIKGNITQSQTQEWHLNFTSLVNQTLGIYDEQVFFLSGNVCSWPANAGGNISALDDPNADYSFDTSNDIALYYSFDSNVLEDQSIGQKGLFQDGQFGAIVEFSDNGNDSTLYVVVRAPENTNKLASWSYELAVSFGTIVFQWDNLLWGNVIDTTNSAALISTGNLTSSGFLSSESSIKLSLDIYSLDYLNALYQDIQFKRGSEYSQQHFTLYIFDYEDRDYFDGYSRSWCAITRGPTIIDPTKINSSYVTRNGETQQQFLVEGLNASTQYIAYILGEYDEYEGGELLTSARYVFAPFIFMTQSTLACEIIYNLDFCSDVAYAVPAKVNTDRHTLAQMYDNYAASLYTNFSKALQQVPCEANQESIFSPLRSCADCEYSYRQWLCAVSIPRCSTMNEVGYKLRQQGQLRNDFVNNDIQPALNYFEVLPCINNCERLVRDCPASLGFQCPSQEQPQFSESYYVFYQDVKYPSCNWMGTNMTSGGVSISSRTSAFVLLIFALVVQIGG